ncbi:hypothetical protein VNI00_005293 [Paramarasmius palmivorus]|uniref:SGNH hydrolase-type esterase domain-containing protein n=1 Tax=Paramarasmius palmivorus TaxID=297713 RepID=A0AAW0DB26_9AGAR
MSIPESPTLSLDDSLASIHDVLANALRDQWPSTRSSISRASNLSSEAQRIQGKPNLSVFQTDVRMQSTLVQMTKSTVTTLAEQVATDITSETHRLVTGVAQNTIHQISSQIHAFLSQLLVTSSSSGLTHYSSSVENLVAEKIPECSVPPSSVSISYPSATAASDVHSGMPVRRDVVAHFSTESPQGTAFTPDLGTAKWIWTGEVLSSPAPPGGARPFRKTITLPQPVDRLTIDITCDDYYTLYVNGDLVGSGRNWTRPQRYNVNFQATSTVVIAVYGVQDALYRGPAGLIAAGIIWATKASDDPHYFVTDESWLTLPTDTFSPSFINPNFFDGNWEKVVAEEGPLGVYVVKPTTATLQNANLTGLPGGIPDAPVAAPASVTSEPDTIIIKNTDPAIYYHGRWDTSCRAWWNGTGFKLHFKNLKKLILNLGSLTFPNAAIAVSVNYQEFQIINTIPGSQTITLGSDVLESAIVRINIRDPSPFNKIQLDNLEINHDASVLRYRPSELVFQFIGDSLSSGYNGADVFKGINQAWPFLLSEHFKAEHNITSQPGAMLTDRPHADQPHGISVEFFHTEDAGYIYTPGHQFTTDWDFSKDVPTASHIFIHLGANDFYNLVTPEEFYQNYLQFLARLRTIYHDQPIFVVAPWGFPTVLHIVYQGVYQRVVDERRRLGDGQIFLVDATKWTTIMDYTPDGHQNAQGHKTVASKFTEYLESWGLRPRDEWATPVNAEENGVGRGWPYFIPNEDSPSS